MKNKSRQEKANLKKEEIIIAAKNLFAKQGYHATSTRSINSAVGASDGLLYHYFPNGKQELLQAVIEHELGIRYEFFKEKSKELPANLSLKEFLYFAASRGMENLARDADIFIILIREAPEISPETRAIIADMFADIQGFLLDNLQKYIDQGVVKKMNVQGMIQQFVSALHTYALLKAASTVFNSEHTEEEYIELVVNHMLQCWEK